MPFSEQRAPSWRDPVQETTKSPHGTYHTLDVQNLLQRILPIEGLSRSELPDPKAMNALNACILCKRTWY